MSKLRTLKKLMKQDKRQIYVALYNNIVHTGITNFLSDRAYLKLTYGIRFGKALDLEHPKTFNEKIQWLKLNDRNPAYTKMVDKVAVKDYVSSIIGEEYIIPTLGVYQSFEDIHFDELPDRFVLKCNHDSGSIVICKGKKNFDVAAARKTLRKALKTDAFHWGREWPYKNVKRSILAETYLSEKGDEEIKDYKLMCFEGKVKCTFVVSERFSEDGQKITIFDENWEKMPFKRQCPNSSFHIPKPVHYDKMVEIAERLSADIPFLRVDFYEVDGRLYFGELTFYPASGWVGFNPPEWDEIFGSWIHGCSGRVEDKTD